MARRTPIAWHNLTHDRPRTAAALAGVGFSLVVIFLQLGFLESALHTATIVLERFDYDAALISQHYHCLADAGTLPRARLYKAASVPGVERVVPLYVRLGYWRSLGRPTGDEPWQRQTALVLGVEARDHVFRDTGRPGETPALERLSRPRALLLDSRSRREFGPQEVQTPVLLNRERMEIVGTFAMGTGFSGDGAAVVDHRDLARIFGDSELQWPSLGLVRLAPGASIADVVPRLRAILPDDVQALSRAELEHHEQVYWVRDKSIGILFIMGVVISFLVGMVVVYQVLSSDIADHIGEYATLKAIGYTGDRVGRVVIVQGLILGLVGYVLALGVALFLYRLVEEQAQIPMTPRAWILGLVLVLANGMTVGSGLISVRKVHEADPADLFR
jgi:putative ABC transport system permease protein